jgi:hypothetical protein
LRHGGWGRLTGWRAPWFTATDERGRRFHLRAAAVTQRLDFAPRSFYQPRGWYYNFDVINPASVTDWAAEFALYLDERGIAASWLTAPSRKVSRRAVVMARSADDWTLDSSASARAFLSGENARLRDAFQSLAGDSRAPRTISGLRTAGLKLVWWAATRGLEWPLSQQDFTDYLTLLATDIGTSGSVSGARGAMLHLCRTNGWDARPYQSGIALIPGAALARRNRHQIKKMSGLTLSMVGRILRCYCFLRLRRAASRQWEFAFGVAVVVAYKVLARWDDLRQMRWDEDYCQIGKLYVRFFLEKRKNSMINGSYVDVAKREDGRRGAFEVIVEAWQFFRSGFVLPFISGQGHVDTSRHMAYEDYVQQLRCCLVDMGTPREEAMKFAGQSARAGAATEAARAGLAPHELCRLAGVRSINWHLGYMRPDFEDRLRASRAMGL